MAANPRLFEMLAEALSQPSRAYRAAQEGLQIPESAMKGYEAGAQFADKIRQRKLLHQTLGEALPGMVPSKLDNLPIDQAKNLVPLALAKAELDKANKPDKPVMPGSLDAILADKVNRGEMSLDGAAKIKRSFSPSIIEKPPQGYEKVDGGLRPIPGGPAYVKNQEQAKKEQIHKDSGIQEAKLIIGKIDDALGKVSGWSAGGMASTKNVPFLGQATGATDLAADIESIHSTLGIQKLMEMKNNSKAGASGMGQLSDREMSLLVSALASLKQEQRPTQLRSRLEKVKKHYQNWLKLEEGVNPYEQGFGTDQGTGDPEADAAIQKINASSISDNEKQARISAVKARAGIR